MAGGVVEVTTLTGAFSTGELNAASYKLMRADEVPEGERHCSHCSLATATNQEVP